MVIVDRPAVAGVFQFGHILHIKSGQHDLSGADGVEKEGVVVPLLHPCGGDIHFVIGSQGDPGNVGVGAGNRGLRIFFDDGGAVSVGLELDLFGNKGLRMERAEIEFIHHGPGVHQMGDFWNKVFKVTAEKGEIFLFRKSPQIFKPGRMGEVPQSHAGVDPRLFEKLQLIQITVQGLFIVYAVFRFDTAPLDGKTIGLMFELLEKADVLFVKLPFIKKFN